MSKRARKKQSLSQQILWGLSLLLILSMVISLFVVALERPPATPTPLPTWTVQPTATQPPTAVPTATATEAIEGPVSPTETPEPAPTPMPTPPPPTATPAAALPVVRFAVAGDSRDNPEVFGRVLAAVQADGSEFLVHTGDLVNSGTEAQWQEFRRSTAGFRLPFHPVPGNHDGLLGSLGGYLAHSGAPAAHYSFDRGPVHLALADSHQGGIGGTELAWLRNDLSATGQPVKVVVLHHPPFDPDGSDHIMAYGSAQFMALMAEQGVDYVFAGHIHAFAQAERDGVQYVYTGGAGAPLYADGHPNAFHHYLRVTVEGEMVTVEVVKV